MYKAGQSADAVLRGRDHIDKPIDDHQGFDVKGTQQLRQGTVCPGP